MNTLRLAFGPGPGDRLLAVGLPDQIFVNEEFMVWTIGDGTFVASGSNVLYIETGPEPALRLGPDACIVGCMAGTSYTLVRVSPAVTFETVVVPGHPVSMGANAVVVRHGDETSAYSLPDLETIALPVGARDAHPQAFESGCGVLWIDGNQVMRQRNGRRASAVGRLGSRPEAWRPGPQGSAVFSVEDALWGLAPSGSLRKLGRYDLDSCRFNADGAQLLAVGENGTAHLDLRTGSVIDFTGAPLLPAGYADEPIVLDEDLGLLRTLSGRTIMDGFSPSAVCCSPTAVYGPGGTAWDIDTGRRRWAHAPLCAEYLLAFERGLVQVGQRITLFDDDGHPLQDLPLPIDPEIDGDIVDVTWREQNLCFEVDEVCVLVDLDGRRLGHEPLLPEAAAPPPEGGWRISLEGILQTDARAIPILIDGHTTSKDGRAMAWSEDGLLLHLCAEPTQPNDQ